MRLRRSVIVVEVIATVLVSEPLLDRQLAFRKAGGNPLAGTAVSVERVLLRPLAREVLPRRVHDRVTFVIDVNHVGAAFTSLLARADVHRGDSQIRALPD